jgi:hypothetical protein
VIASAIIVIASAITFTKGVSVLLDRASQATPVWRVNREPDRLVPFWCRV